MQHGFDNPAKAFHGVFADDPIAATEMAWEIAVQDGIQPIIGSGGNWNYIVPWLEAGLQGGNKGSGGILNSILISTEPGCNKVVTAFPY